MLFLHLFEIYRNSLCIINKTQLHSGTRHDIIIQILNEGGIFLATLDDIAQELGISKSTVSKALNDAKDVSKRMKQAVLEKAVELGYSRSARTSDAPRLAVFITNMEFTQPEDFGYEIVVGFRQAAEPAGFHVELIPLDIEMQSRIRYDQYMIMSNYCGGLFLGLSLMDPWLKEFQACKTPTVLYDNHVSGNPNVTNIGVDNIEGIELACQYLRSLGHERIGYLSGELLAPVYRQRYQAFSRVMTETGLRADDGVMGSAHQINTCLNQHLPRLLENGCTAIICSHDLLANSVMLHCKDLGLRIPEDVSIMGFDDIPLCRYTIPPLTTIRQNRPALGKSAFYALSCHLKGVSLSTHLLHAELIRRGSCSAAPEKEKI